MKRHFCSPRTRHERLKLALLANCRAGAVRRHCMVELAKRVGVFHSPESLEHDLIGYTMQITEPGTITRILNWALLVTKASEPVPVPVFIPHHQLRLAA